MKRSGLAVDIATAGATLTITVAMIGTGGLGAPDPTGRALDVPGLLLAGATALPLAARRRAPGTAFAVVALASIALIALRYPLDAPVGAAIAGYAVADAHSGDRGVRRAAAFGAVVGFVPLVAVIYLAAGFSPAAFTTELGTWMLAFCGMWLIGDRARLRRERAVDLEERARRAEREAGRERRLAAAEERTRIARELHDSAGHAINVILVQAGAARLLHGRDPGRTLQAIGTIEEVARDTVGELDRMVRALRRDDGDLRTPADLSAVDELVDRHRAMGLTVDVTVHGERPTRVRGASQAAYRILQEALTNAARHGDGTAVVELRYTVDTIEIDVRNGYRPAGAQRPDGTEGHGIVGMRERATLLGGTCVAGPVRDRFQVLARLPLHRDESPAGPLLAERAAVAGHPPSAGEWDRATR
ncbi:sensor histidine kinase [Plantactinospora mayteni]|uniref:histidine kinase n=1 Tax=Plantactinospora mayteni TaxID=566021 RepID=A0ABQ4ERW1_9ACTN|nr:histidine kinase [Plantactinospora mayteni]GIG97403.1 two-component sensor histidine kinase [Plantactinospora mayteni]